MAAKKSQIGGDVALVGMLATGAYLLYKYGPAMLSAATKTVKAAVSPAGATQTKPGVAGGVPLKLPIPLPAQAQKAAAGSSMGGGGGSGSAPGAGSAALSWLNNFLAMATANNNIPTIDPLSGSILDSQINAGYFSATPLQDPGIYAPIGGGTYDSTGYYTPAVSDVLPDATMQDPGIYAPFDPGGSYDYSGYSDPSGSYDSSGYYSPSVSDVLPDVALQDPGIYVEVPPADTSWDDSNNTTY